MNGAYSAQTDRTKQALTLCTPFRADDSQRWNGEVAIRWAVLLNALNSFRETSRSINGVTLVRHYQDKKWFYGEDRSWPFSFLNICEALGLDPAFVRKGLRRSADGGTQ